MKKLILLFLLVPALSFANDISTIAGKAISAVSTIAGKAKADIATVGGGGVPAGTPAASGNYNPDADVTTATWGKVGTCTNYFNCVDEEDGTLDETNYIREWATSQVIVFGMEEITGTVSTLRIRAFGNEYNSSNQMQVDISPDGGSTWVGYQDIALPDGYANRAWVNCDFTGLSWDGTTEFRVRFSLRITGSENSNIFAFYAVANP